MAPADDEEVPEGVAPGDCVTGESEITGLGSFCLRYCACQPAARDDCAGEGAGDDCAGEGAGDNVPRDVAAGEDAAGDGATGYDGAVDDTLDAPADVDPGGIGPLHIVAGVPVCGAGVTGSPGLEAESPTGFGVADPLVPIVGVALSVALPVGVGVALPVGVRVGEDVAVDVDVTGVGDCTVLSWLGDVLTAGSE